MASFYEKGHYSDENGVFQQESDIKGSDINEFDIK